MKDVDGKVLYIGKAVNLKNRVRSYFQASSSHTPRISLMVSKVNKVDFIVTENEVEALILENILIKKEKPYFNVMLRDDKTYPYLKLTTYEKYPRLQVVRRVLKDGAEYFGPYVSGKSVRSAKALIHRIFPIRSSKDNLDNAILRRPCLNYQMKRCLAPCADKITPEDYGQMVERIRKFLLGKDNEILEELKAKMAEAAGNQEYELAAIIRDQIFAIQSIHEKQKIDTARDVNEDYIAALCEGGGGIIRIMMVRSGKVAGDQDFTFKKVDDPAELIGAFIQQFYSSAFAIPPEVVVNVKPVDSEVVEKWLTNLRGARASIICPERGRKKKLIDMATENARLNLASFTEGEEARKEALAEVRRITGMSEWPSVMEAIDVSNISGVSAVGSLVTFRNGKASPKDYKRYRINTVGPDDYAMIAEIVRRRFLRLKEEGKEFPDLLLIDGGPGQVTAAYEALKSYSPKQVLLGIAKGEDRENPETDRIFLHGRKEPLPFPPTSPGKFLLQRLRDEAHRFAINFHRKVRDKSAFSSNVDSISGFGPKRKRLLIKKFGSLKAAKKATIDEIRTALSVSERLAQEILQKL